MQHICGAVVLLHMCAAHRPNKNSQPRLSLEGVPDSGHGSKLLLLCGVRLYGRMQGMTWQAQQHCWEGTCAASRTLALHSHHNT